MGGTSSATSGSSSSSSYSAPMPGISVPAVQPLVEDGPQGRPPACSRPRFVCPFCADRNWATFPQLQAHVEKFHLAAEIPTPDSDNYVDFVHFLGTFGRRVFFPCHLLALAKGQCRRCKLGPPSLDPPHLVHVVDASEATEDLSCWEDTVDLPRSTLRYIPSGVVEPWAAALADELDLFMAEPTRLRALQLMRMPLVILAP